jgi:hypothetical protein
MNKYIISVVLFIILCFSARGGTYRTDVEPQKYLDFGKKFYCVKTLSTEKKTENRTQFSTGSCVILNSHWIITAGHIADEPFDIAYVTIGKKKHFINKIIVNKNYNSKKLIGDIALGFCEKGFGEVETPVLMSEQIKLNSKCSIAGYGRYGDMKNGAKYFDGKIRAGTNTLVSRFHDMVVCVGSNDKTKTSLEFLPNVGDSGGGLFVDGKLAGIMSLVFSKDKTANSDYGDEAAFVEIYPYLEWINKYVKKTEM